MNEPILHHYPASPYAEKIRLMLGFKKLHWKSVLIPKMMPKPDVIALTGGYRRTPILQVGADIYCDTSLITRTLESLAPSPTLYAYGDTLAVQSLSHFADQTLFNITIPMAIFDAESFGIFFPGSTPESMQRFREDRAAMRKGGTVRRGTIPECRALYAYFAPMIESQFADGRAYLLGASPCVADFALYHTMWVIGRVPKLAGLLEPLPKISQWMQRMKGIGYGSSSEITSGEAIRIANSSRPENLNGAVALETDGIALGQPAQVMPIDYALDPVKGELLNASADEIVIRRSDPRAGTLQVHFPRFGFQLARAS